MLAKWMAVLLIVDNTHVKEIVHMLVFQKGKKDIRTVLTSNFMAAAGQSFLSYG